MDMEQVAVDLQAYEPSELPRAHSIPAAARGVRVMHAGRGAGEELLRGHGAGRGRRRRSWWASSPRGTSRPSSTPKGKAEQNLSLKTVSSFVVILTGVQTA